MVIQRGSKLVRVVIIAFGVAWAVGALSVTTNGLVSWRSTNAAVAAVLGAVVVAAAIRMTMVRIVVEDDRLVLYNLFRTIVIPKSEITGFVIGARRVQGFAPAVFVILTDGSQIGCDALEVRSQNEWRRQAFAFLMSWISH